MDHPSSNEISKNEWIKDIRLERESQAEIFSGIACPILITGDNLAYIKRVACEFCAEKSLPFVKFETGVNGYLSEKQTPDGRPGVLISLWTPIPKGRKVIQKTMKAIEILKNSLKQKIFNNLITKFNLSIFSFEPENCSEKLSIDLLENKDTQDIQNKKIKNTIEKKERRNFNKNNSKENNTAGFDSWKEISDYGDGFSLIEEINGREVVAIPLLGSIFYCEKFLPFYRGIMGGNLMFQFFKPEKIYKLEYQIMETVDKFHGTTLIYAAATSASKIGTKWIKNNNVPISSNFDLIYHIDKEHPYSKIKKKEDKINEKKDLNLKGKTYIHKDVSMKAKIEKESKKIKAILSAKEFSEARDALLRQNQNTKLYEVVINAFSQESMLRCLREIIKTLLINKEVGKIFMASFEKTIGHEYIPLKIVLDLHKDKFH